ncbi:MAG: DUF3853 family protein [Salinivirgaceae bacterium]|nr:DUF3853 family protein [Salinivirgaceae bacterium]
MTEKKNLPIWQLSTGELIDIISTVLDSKLQKQEREPKGNTYVYGIRGIAHLFGCSIATANQIKRSGLIDDAITQINRKIVVDRELALKLIKRKGGCHE